MASLRSAEMAAGASPCAGMLAELLGQRRRPGGGQVGQRGDAAVVFPCAASSVLRRREQLDPQSFGDKWLRVKVPAAASAAKVGCTADRSGQVGQALGSA